MNEEFARPGDYTPPPRAHRDDVRRRLTALMVDHGLDVLVALSAQNSYYLSGYASSLAYLLPRPYCGAVAAFAPDVSLRPQLFVTDFEGLQIPNEFFDCDISLIQHWTGLRVSDPAGHPRGATPADLDGVATFTHLARLIATLPASARVGADLAGLSATDAGKLTDSLGGRSLVDASNLFTMARALKTDWEISQLRAACRITEDAIGACQTFLPPGISEAQLRSTFESFVAERGSDTCLQGITIGRAFAIRRQPSTRPGEAGEIVKFDCGAEVNGYCADIARTLSIGPMLPAAVDILTCLEEAKTEVLTHIRPGVRFDELYRIGIDAVTNQGLEDYARGHIGHSIGLAFEIEEKPLISPHNFATLQAGMVLCVELPFYTPDLGGFNTEDMLLVTQRGFESFMSQHWRT